MAKFREWWSSLAMREQQLLSVAAIAVVIAILYWGIWTPVANAQQTALKQRDAQLSTLNYVKQTANQIAALSQAGNRPRSSGSISSIATQAATSYQLEITRMQPQGKQLRLWMDDVPFDALLGFLDYLVQEKGLSLDTIDIAKAETAGMVTVRQIQLSQ